MKKIILLFATMLFAIGVTIAQTKNRVVDIEHHFGNRTMFDAFFLETQGCTLDELPEDQRAIYYTTLDLGAGRIAAMDAAGVNYAHLSLTTPGAEAYGPAMGKQIAREANDSIAKAIAQYPDRIGGWMTLYPEDVEFSLQEIDRCKNMGLYGWACLSNMQGKRLDDPKYWPIFKKLEELGMPVYLHPEYSKDEAIAEFGYCINGPTFGFGADVLTTFMRMVCRGLFDEYPNLKIILGHDGEGLPFFKDRINAAYRCGLDKVQPSICNYQHEPSYYVDHNLWITTSGNFSTEALRCCLDEMPEGHVMISTDYPYEDFAGAVSFVRDNLKLTEDERLATLGSNAMALGFGYVEANTVSFDTTHIAMTALDTTEVIIKLKKDIPLSSLQMNITLPEGISYVDGSAALGVMATDATLKVKQYEGANKYNVQILTKNQTEFVGDEGQILSFKVKANKALTGKLGLTNIIGSTNEATPQQVEMPDTACNITVSKRPSDFAFAKGTEEHPDTIVAGTSDMINYVNSSSIDVEFLNFGADKAVNPDDFLEFIPFTEPKLVWISTTNKTNYKEPVLFRLLFTTDADDVYEEGKDTLYIQWIPIIYDNLNDTIALAEDYSNIIERTEYASIKAGLDEAIATAKTFLTATSQTKVDNAAHSLKSAIDDAIKTVEEYNYDNGIFTGVNVSTSDNTSSLFFQTTDKPSVAIRRDGNSRIAELRLSGENEVRRSVELNAGNKNNAPRKVKSDTDEVKMVLSFSKKVSTNKTFSFTDQVDGKTTTREEVDAVHGDGYNIHFERNFTSTKYEAISLPFDLPAEKAREAGLTLYRLNMAANAYGEPNEQGFVDEGTEAVIFRVTTIPDGQKAVANRPYLVKANQTGKVAIDLKDATLNLAKSLPVTSSTTMVSYVFAPSVTTVMAKDLSGKYVVRDGMLAYVIAHPADLPAWRWYMEPSIKGDVIYYTKYQFIADDEEDSQTTDITEVETPMSEKCVIYNLSGQRVTNPMKGNIYIINGKKVLY